MNTALLEFLKMSPAKGLLMAFVGNGFVFAASEEQEAASRASEINHVRYTTQVITDIQRPCHHGRKGGGGALHDYREEETETSRLFLSLDQQRR